MCQKDLEWQGNTANTSRQEEPKTQHADSFPALLTAVKEALEYPVEEQHTGSLALVNRRDKNTHRKGSWEE